MTNTKRDCLRFFVVFILSIFILLSGCSAIETKPDSCKDEPRCELHNTFLDPPVRLEVGVSREISICACRPWNNTGIKVDIDQEFEFALVKSPDDWIWVDGEVPSSPVDGWQGGFRKIIGFLASFMKRSDKANWYALVGTVGNEKDDSDSFAVFKDGNTPISMPSSGTLYIYANDKFGRYFNNKGKIGLVVTRVK